MVIALIKEPMKAVNHVQSCVKQGYSCGLLLFDALNNELQERNSDVFFSVEGFQFGC